MITQSFIKENTSIKEKLISLDYILVLLILILGAISFFAMYSTERGHFDYHTKNHVYRFFIFFAVFILVSFTNIRFWYKFSYLFFIIVLLLLLSVDLFGITASGSKRWISLYIFNLQPSELMKVSLIIFLARYYYKIPSSNVNHIKFMIVPLFAIFVPVSMVITQPDLGTAMLIAIGGIGVIWLTGFRLKYFLFSSIVMICSLPVVIAFLKPYQKLRILTFLNPERDPLGAGYQIIQSKIAVGSGGIFGKGYLKGSQSYLDYLPEKHTDFIFTLYAEEFGFVGSVGLLIIYGALLYRIIKIGNNSRNNFSRLFCYGFATAFFVYVVVNMSMVLGLLPIVGSPLPIMSYGGSAMLSMMIGFGIVMSCKVTNTGDVN